ncbi:hypothetical protein [Microseira wollei]|uniref:hypothetical protein n=1 Tax=Microseira wollei TaxID=467598 RepID=UPI001CFDD2DA|nr:hypothetical protein [Microseira wollei]
MLEFFPSESYGVRFPHNTAPAFPQRPSGQSANWHNNANAIATTNLETGFLAAISTKRQFFLETRFLCLRTGVATPTDVMW